MPSEEAHEYPIFIEEKDLQLNPTKDNDSSIPPSLLLGTGYGRGSLSTFRLAPTNFPSSGTNTPESSWLSSLPNFPPPTFAPLRTFPSAITPTSAPARRVKPSLRSPLSIPRHSNAHNLSTDKSLNESEFMDYMFTPTDYFTDHSKDRNFTSDRIPRLTQDTPRHRINNRSPKRKKKKTL